MLVWRQPLCCCRQSGRVSRGERDRFRKAPLSPRLPAPRLPFIAGSAVSAGGARPSPVDPIGRPRNSPLRTSGQTARSSSRCQRPRRSRESRPPPLPPSPSPPQTWWCLCSTACQIKSAPAAPDQPQGPRPPARIAPRRQTHQNRGEAVSAGRVFMLSRISLRSSVFCSFFREDEAEGSKCFPVARDWRSGCYVLKAVLHF